MSPPIDPMQAPSCETFAGALKCQLAQLRQGVRLPELRPWDAVAAQALADQTLGLAARLERLAPTAAAADWPGFRAPLDRELRLSEDITTSDASRLGPSPAAGSPRNDEMTAIAAIVSLKSSAQRP